MSCRYIETDYLAAGWVCCQCSVYNGLQRPLCKECNHARCLPRALAGVLGQAPGPPLVWRAQAPVGGDYAFASGGRYAVLASVSKNVGEQEVSDYLNAHGWLVTYAWQEGQASRAVFPIDAWLDSLAPDARSNHRWLYAEANRTGPDESLGASAPWPLTLYQIANVFRAVPGSPSSPGAPAPPFLPTSTPAVAPLAPPPPLVLVGTGFALGLAASLAWQVVRRLL